MQELGHYTLSLCPEIQGPVLHHLHCPDESEVLLALISYSRILGIHPPALQSPLLTCSQRGRLLFLRV